jgi:carboxyl-terminal processing protease
MKAIVLMSLSQKLHAAGPKLNIKAAKKLVSQFFETIDPMHLLFTRSERAGYVDMPDEDYELLMIGFGVGETGFFRQIIGDLSQTGRVRLLNSIDEAIEKSKDKDNLKETRPRTWPKNKSDIVDRLATWIHIRQEAFREYLDKDDARTMVIMAVKRSMSKYAGTKKSAAERLMLNAYLQSLDPHSQYLTADEMKDLNTRLRGHFVGVGVHVSSTPVGLVIRDLIEGGPADKSGKIEAGDQIIEVDDVAVAGQDLNETVKKIVGKAGTKVKLKLLKKKSKKTETVTIIRQRVDMSKANVVSNIVETKKGIVGVVKIESFITGVGGMFTEALDKMKKAKVAGVVLDLRGNGGGLLNESLKILDSLLSGGAVLGQVKRGSPADWSLDPRSMRYAGPLVIMVDKWSASASEIVAGAIKDHGRGIILGPSKTYGKGSVQVIMNVNGLGLKGGLKLTIRIFYRPNGKSTNAIGITPDIMLPKREGDKGFEVAPNSMKPSDIGDMLGNFPEFSKKNIKWMKKNLPDLKKKSEKRSKGKKLNEDEELGEAIKIIIDMAKSWE